MNDKPNHKYNGHHIDYRKLWGSHESNFDGPANRRNPWRDTVVANLDVESGSGEETLQMDSFQMVTTWQLGDTAPVCGVAPISDMTEGNSDVEYAPHTIKLREHHNADVQSGKHDRTQAVVLPENGFFIY